MLTTATLMKISHVTGALGLFLAFGILLNIASDQRRGRLALALHGISLLVLILSGFSILAYRGLHGPLPRWILLKILIWILFAVSASFFKRGLLPQILALPFILFLGALATYCGIVSSIP